MILTALGAHALIRPAIAGHLLPEGEGSCPRRRRAPLPRGEGRGEGSRGPTELFALRFVLMLLIDCPYCGMARPEIEFAYGGEAHIARAADPSARQR